MIIGSLFLPGQHRCSLPSKFWVVSYVSGLAIRHFSKGRARIET